MKFRLRHTRNIALFCALVAGGYLASDFGGMLPLEAQKQSDDKQRKRDMDDTPKPEFSKDLRESAGEDFLAVVKLTQEHRSDLFRYCHGLTGNLWDAEDLVQETVLKVHTRMSRMSGVSIQAPRAYLFRMATNTWIDWKRREERGALSFGDLANEEASEDDGSALDLEAAFDHLLVRLPDRQRVALMLCDVFGFTPTEASAFAETTPGAMKVALRRARKAMEAARKAEKAESAEAKPLSIDQGLLQKFVDAFNKRDMQGLVSLFSNEISAEIVGVLDEYGSDAIENGSLFYTLFDFATGEPQPFPADYPMAKIEVVDGERVVLLMYTSRKDKITRVGDIVRLTATGDKLTTMRYYYFSPEVLRAVADRVGNRPVTHGYYFNGDHMTSEEE